jgi:hypothetical protein
VRLGKRLKSQNMKYLYIVFLTTILSFNSQAQYTDAEITALVNTAGEEMLLHESTRMIIDEYYFQATPLVDKLLTYKPASSNYNYRKGFLLLESQRDYAQAIPYLEHAVKATDKHFDVFSVREKEASVNAHYQLARAYHLGEQIALAKIQYSLFIAKADHKNILVREAKNGLAQCIVAEELLKNPGKTIVKNVGKIVNSPYPEYAPVISLDGSALYFTSRRPWETGNDSVLDPRYNLYPEDVYVSYRTPGGGWEVPERLAFCVNGQNEATLAISPDEKRVYVYQDVTGAGDIYYSDFTVSSFSDMTPIALHEVNTKAWETHCTVTPDGNDMYFISDRSGGYGGRDIYRVVKMADGSWSAPQNLGPRINTPFDEDAPFISTDNKTLYFSSNGPKSMGGFDIFVGVRNADNEWSDAVHLGYPVNSCGDDLYYTTTADGLKAYFTSFRDDGSGEKDIYEVQNDYVGLENIAVLKGHVRTNGQQPVPVGLSFKVNCLNCGNELERTGYPKQRDGSFFSMLEPCRMYELVFYRPDGETAFYSETFETGCDRKYEEVNREILLDVDNMTAAIVPREPIHTRESVIVDLPAVSVINYKTLDFKHFFAYNDNKLLSKEELADFVQEVEQQLKDGRPSITVKVHASASTVPTRKFKSNAKLTQIRAENMKYDLITWFQQHSAYADKVNVVIVSAIVDGPAYENDAQDKDKYDPYQYVLVETE